MSRRTVVAVLSAVAVAAIVVVAIVAARPDHEDPRAPLRTLAQELIPPAGSTRAFADTESDNPLQVVRGWNSQGTLDTACSEWGNALKMWVGVDNMSGELTPNVGCSYRATKEDHPVLLSVSVFAGAAPQAVLTVRS